MNMVVWKNEPWWFEVKYVLSRTTVIWPKYCRYGVKHYIINQSINLQNNLNLMSVAENGLHIHHKYINNTKFIPYGKRNITSTIKTCAFVHFLLSPRLVFKENTKEFYLFFLTDFDSFYKEKNKIYQIRYLVCSSVKGSNILKYVWSSIDSNTTFTCFNFFFSYQYAIDQHFNFTCSRKRIIITKPCNI